MAGLHLTYPSLLFDAHGLQKYYFLPQWTQNLLLEGLPSGEGPPAGGTILRAAFGGGGGGCYVGLHCLAGSEAGECRWLEPLFPHMPLTQT